MWLKLAGAETIFARVFATALFIHLADDNSAVDGCAET